MTTTRKSKPRQAEILREYGPYPGPQIDAETGAILRTIESDRFVTGVSCRCPKTTTTSKERKMYD